LDGFYYINKYHIAVVDCSKLKISINLQ